MTQDSFQQAKELYDDATEAWRENYERVQEDFEFSNPADPQQWRMDGLKDRKDDRLKLTMDQTNQYINQVVNDGRQNTPAMSAIPGDGTATKEGAEQLTGIFRHIEYISKAGLAYDTSLEHSARGGIGWLRIYPKIVRPELNHQELVICSPADPRSVKLDGDSKELDGNDALHGFVETTYSEKAYKRKWPKGAMSSFDKSGTWYMQEGIRVCEFFKVEFEKENRVTAMLPGGSIETVSETEFEALTKQLGYRPAVLETFEAIRRTVKWAHMNGVEFLEETKFPGPWIPLVPVYGHLLFVNDKRYVCGLTRRLMAGQIFHNVQMTSLAESMANQPKAPYMVPALAVANHTKHWEALAEGNPSYLPYDHIDGDGNPIPPPSRQAPPAFPAAFGQAALIGQNEMQASVGMFKSTLGQQSNAVSGKAKLADKLEGDTATYHYRDNQRISIEHLARIAIDALPEVYDVPRIARMLGMDGATSTVLIDPDMKTPTRKRGNKVVALNPGIGYYDARVKIGPSHTTLREEFQDRLTQLGQGNPALAAAIAPLLIKMANVPEAEKVARVAIALLPPPVQAIYNEDENDEQQQSPQVQALMNQLQQAQQVLQNMSAQLQQAQQEAQQAKMDTAVKAADVQVKAQAVQIDKLNAFNDKFRAETERMKLVTELETEQAEQQQENDAMQEQTATIVATIDHLAQGIAALLDKANDNSNEANTINALQTTHDATMGAISQLINVVTKPRVITPERDPQTGLLTRAIAHYES